VDTGFKYPPPNIQLEPELFDGWYVFIYGPCQRTCTNTTAKSDEIQNRHDELDDFSASHVI